MTCVRTAPAWPSAGADPLLMVDLLATGQGLAAALPKTVSDGHWLDAYLLGCGLLQLVEDRLHPDPLQLRRAAGYLKDRPSPTARAAAAVAAAAAATLGVRRRTPASTRLIRARTGLVALTGALAALVIAPEPAGAGQPAPVAPTGLTGSTGSTGLAGLAEGAAAAGALVGADVVRLPACFRSFDLHPDDVRWLSRAFLDRHPHPAPVCVVGVRTSGSYLAPLHAAALRAGGVAQVEQLTYRPGRPFLAWEREVLRATARAGGRIVVTDDPPGSGASLAATLAAVVDAGVPDQTVTLLLSVFDDAELPPPLRGWSLVVQPWSQWSIHARLRESAVRGPLEALSGPRWRVDRADRLTGPTQAHRRGHARARFAVRLTDRRTGQAEQRQVLVEGAGLGYLGRHAIAVASSLPEQLPRVYGFGDGLLFRDWLPAPDQPVDEATGASVIAGYVAARSRALAAPDDPTARLRGRDPVWEVAAQLLSMSYGPLAPAARPYLLEPLTRRLLKPDRTSVVDGATDIRHWLPDPDTPGLLRKVDFHQRAFGHLELACYDAAFDLAGAASDPPSHGFEALLRRAYQAQTGQAVDGERWLLYRLAQLWRLGKAGDIDADRVARRSAAAVHDYLAGCFLHDQLPGAGPLCAIDLDGVLETDRLGYPAGAPMGVIALRALLAHGYRPVLVTGRSLGDARDRCSAFGLAGAVAEYGTVIYDHRDGAATDLRSDADARLLGRVRDDLRDKGVSVETGYRFAVRARIDGGPLPADLIRATRVLADPALWVVHGQGQTDITVAGLDKGSGLTALADRLGEPRCALAVGDSAADLPMLALATLARAPRNADPILRAAGVPITRHAYQAGLADACADLLGHRPGGCPRCRTSRFTRRTRQLLAVLSLPEAGLRGIPVRTLRLAVLAAGAPRW